MDLSTHPKIDLAATLQDQRTAIIDALVTIAGPRAEEARHLIRQLALAEKMLAAANAGPKFIRAEKMIQAVVIYLDFLGVPATKEEITRVIVESEFQGLTENTGWRVGKSIDNFINGTGAKTSEVIKERNGLIGKYDWPDSMFSRNQ